MNVDRLVNRIGIGCSLFLLAAFVLTMCAGCAHDRCRADGKLPPDATFDELRDLKREQCQ